MHVRVFLSSCHLIFEFSKSQKGLYLLITYFIKIIATNSNLYEEDDSESGSGWIQWFCDLEGHEFFIEVDEDYIRDNFNLHGLRERVTYFK